MSSKGNNNGLTLIWNHNVSVSISSFFLGYIDVTIDDDDERWSFTSFYGNLVREKKSGFVEAFKQIK